VIGDVIPFGLYQEYRPWRRDGFESVNMLSYCYVCNIADELGETQFEAHEINNGMVPVWMDIDAAIQHNLDTMANSNKNVWSASLLQMIFSITRLVCANVFGVFIRCFTTRSTMSSALDCPQKAQSILCCCFLCQVFNLVV